MEESKNPGDKVKQIKTKTKNLCHFQNEAIEEFIWTEWKPFQKLEAA